MDVHTKLSLSLLGVKFFVLNYVSLLNCATNLHLSFLLIFLIKVLNEYKISFSKTSN